MGLPKVDTRYLFFTGKGGVGKTSLSCATGIALAESGKRVLIVSTDPASNLDEVLGSTLSAIPSPIPEVPGLYALNIDPEASAHAYRERMVSPYRGILPPAAIASMEEQFSGACTVEIAAFDEFSALLGDPDKTQDFDRPHRSHLAPVVLAVGVERFHRIVHGGRVLFRAIGGLGKTTQLVCRDRSAIGRCTKNHRGLGQPTGNLGVARGGTD